MRKDISTWKPGQKVYLEGDPPEFAYLIVSGIIQFFGSKKTLLGSAGPSEVFGEISCYLNRNHSVTAIAQTDVVVKKIHKTELRKIISKTNPVIMGMLRSTYHRLAESNLKQEGHVEKINEYSLMFEKSTAEVGGFKNRIDSIQEKLDKVITEK